MVTVNIMAHKVAPENAGLAFLVHVGSQRPGKDLDSRRKGPKAGRLDRQDAPAVVQPIQAGSRAGAPTAKTRSEVPEEIASPNTQCFRNPQKRVEADPLLAAFDLAHVHRMQLSLLR